MDIRPADLKAPELLKLFSEHDAHMLDFLGEHRKYYTPYSQAENIGRAVRQTVADFYDIEPAAVQVSIANYQSSNLAAENIKAS